MSPSSEPSKVRPEVLLVYKKSKLALYREKKDERLRALLERKDAVVEPLIAADEAHQGALAAVKASLTRAQISFRTCYRARIAESDTRGRLVVTVGGDGTLLDASHRIREAAVLGVNSDPVRSVGFLCAARADSFPEVLDAVLRGALQPMQVARLAGTLDGVPLRVPVLNEILVAEKNPAATARYLLRADGHEEAQKSSGVWIAAPAGSTGAIASAGGEVQPLDDDRMQVRVREPYLADGAPPTLVSCFVARGGELFLQSRMRAGALYLDGPHQRVPFPLGARLIVHPRGEPLLLYVTEEMRARRDALHARGAGTVVPRAGFEPARSASPERF